jgi:hybrid cluster-associated redox disulfide protein
MTHVTPFTKIGELLKSHPDAAKILKGFGLDCLGCGGAEQETILLGATAHGLDAEAIIEALNAALK